MKKSRFYLQFGLISLIFVLLPIIGNVFFTKEFQVMNPALFSPWTLVMALTFFLIYFQLIIQKEEGQDLVFPEYPFIKKKLSKTGNYLLDLLFDFSYFLVVLGLLFAAGALFTVLEVFLLDAEPVKINFPENASGWIICFFTYLVSAFFEEIIYRLYLPEALRKILENKKDSVKSLVSEIVPLLLFASGHLYLGLPAFFNAVVSGVTLRFFTLKTKNVLHTGFAHFLYNFLTLLFLYFQA